MASTKRLHSATDGQRPFGSALVPLLALALAMATGFTLIGSFSTVQEGAKAELHLDDFELSLIQGVGAAIPLALLSIPIGLLVDRANRTRLLIALAGVWTLGTLLTALATGGTMLFAARMLTGIGTTGALTAALSLGADLCAPAQRGRAMLIINIGKMVGAAAAFALAGALFGLFDHGGGSGWRGSLEPWRATHLALACMGAALIIPLLLLREPLRHEVSEGPDAPFRAVAGQLWSRRSFLVPLFIGESGVVMADTAAGIWAAPVLTRNYGLSPEQFGSWMGLLVLATGLAGSVLGGFAADWGQAGGRRGGVLIGALLAAVVGIPAALFPVAPTVPTFAAMLGVLVFCGTVTGLIASVALTVLIPNELRGICIGTLIALAGLVGYGAAPTLVAAVSALLGGERHLGQGLAIVGTAVSIVSALGFFSAIRRAPDPVIKPIIQVLNKPI